MVSVGVVGASGYAGAELIRLLHSHPSMEVKYLTAQTYSGESVSSLYRSFTGAIDNRFEDFHPKKASEECEALFFALPHGKSMEMVPTVMEMCLKVVDLGADFRLCEHEVFRQWYGISHYCPQLINEAVYGLTEMHREDVKSSMLVANPGCYPTGALLGILPLARAGLVGPGHLVIDSKSGASGAGRKLDLSVHFSQLDENLKPYAVAGHRHLPEIEQELDILGQLGDKSITFVPHLVPMVRGILTTIYIPLKSGTGVDGMRDAFEQSYSDEPFVEVLDVGDYPETKAVQGTNRCHIGFEVQKEGELGVVMTAIDNLGKGAAGQAVQNMNLMCGLEETTGLEGTALFP